MDLILYEKGGNYCFCAIRRDLRYLGCVRAYLVCYTTLDALLTPKLGVRSEFKPSLCRKAVAE